MLIDNREERRLPRRLINRRRIVVERREVHRTVFFKSEREDTSKAKPGSSVTQIGVEHFFEVSHGTHQVQMERG